jgi:hypothetical protein
VANLETIEKLIQCESQGANVSRLDSNGRISDGILQFNRGPLNTLVSSTWATFSEASGITGDPRIPADAIRMTDWAINHGLGPHWTCWKIMTLGSEKSS